MKHIVKGLIGLLGLAFLRRAAVLLPLLVSVSVLAGLRPGEVCARDDSSPDPIPVVVQLQWRHQWEFAGFYAAIEQGYYREAGLDVTLREYDDGIDIIDEVVSGRAAFGTFYSTLIAERMKGRAVRLLASYFQRSPLVILTRPDIFSPADLEGKRLMAESQEIASANFVQMFKRFGLSPADIDVVRHDFSVRAFVDGEVDAVSAFSTNEPYLLHKQGVAFNVIDPGDYGVALYDLNLFTSERYAAEHPDLVRAFVAATNRGWEYALAHPEELVDLILARWNTQGKSRDHLRFEAHQTHSVMLPEVYPIGSIDPGQLRRIEDLFIETGFAERRVPVAEMLFEPVRQSPASDVVEGLVHARTFGETARNLSIDLTEEEEAFVAEHRDMVLGVDQYWRPLIFEHPDGTVSGIDADTVTVINDALGTRIRFRTGQWSDLVELARRREIDGLSSAAANPERADMFLYTRPYIRIGRTILVGAGNPLGIHSSSDLAGRRVGFMHGNLDERKLIESIPGAIPVDGGSNIDVLNDLIQGRIDAMVGNEAHRWYLSERDVHSVQEAFVLDRTTDLVFAIRKDWPLMASAIDKVLAALPDNRRLAIKRRYLPDRPAVPPGGIVLGAGEQEWLDARRRRLTYCFNPVWTPLDYSEGGEHRGMFRDYMDLFARKLDVTLVPITAADWPSVLRIVEARGCDLVSGLVRTAERESYLDFTAPYLNLIHVLVGRSDAPFVAGIASLEGQPIGVPPSSAIESLLKKRYPDQPFVELSDLDQLQEGLDSGRVYAVVATLEHAAELVERGLGRFHIIAKLDNPYPISVAVRDDEPMLLSIMQKAVGAITPAERDRIAARRTTFEIEERLDLTRLWQVIGVLGLVAVFLGYRHLELTRLNRRLRSAKDAAEVASRVKGEFLANMSHEIRTPLNAMLNLAAIGERTSDPARLRRYLEEIQRAGRTLLGVVNELLDFSRLEGGGDAYRGDVFDLSVLIEGVAAIGNPLARDKGIALRIEVPPGLGGRWLGDGDKIERVLVNLVGNAVKFTEHGEVALVVDTAGAEDGLETLVFEVRDTGIGIDPEQLPGLFEPFRQADPSLTRRHPGSGLGLAIVKRLVERMQGKVSADRRPWGGSVFRVEVPLMRLPGGEVRSSAQVPSPVRAPMSPSGSTRPRRVLVVEDNGVNRQIACELVGELGLGVEGVEDGESALSALDADPDGFGLVLMDVQMPGLDGYETTRRLRVDPRFADLPVVAVTAQVLAEDRQRALEAGMSGHLAKPYDRDALAGVLKRWVELRPRESSAAAAVRAAPVATESADAWLDVESGLRLTRGDASLYARLLRELVSAQRPQLERLEVGWSGLARLAHTLRGSAPLLGATRLAAIAATLDDQLRAGAAADAAAVALLADALSATLQEAQVYLDGADGARGGACARRADEGGSVRSHLLIVEDDPTVAAVLEALLGDEHRVSVAGGGVEGLARARAGDRPDLILLDVNMEDLDGHSVCERLKADPETCDIPVIFVTGRGTAEDEQRGFQLGAVDYIHKPFERQVVLARVRNHLTLKRQGDVLTQLSEQDALTGLPNRRRLERYLDETWARPAAAGRSVALLMIDVDHFKAYNDHYGHLQGDECLRQVAAAIQDACARVGGLVGRYGGEELLWVIPDADEEQVQRDAEAVVEAVRAQGIPHAGRPNGEWVTVSVGVGLCQPSAGVQPTDCLDIADRKLYQAKSAGRGRAQL